MILLLAGYEATGGAQRVRLVEILSYRSCLGVFGEPGFEARLEAEIDA